MAKAVVIDLKINTKDGVNSIGEINEGVKTTLSTMRDLEDAASAINDELRHTQFGTEEYAELSKELIKVNTELKNQELALEALDHEQVASEIKSVVGGLTDMAGGFALVVGSSGTMEQIVQTFAKVEGASRIATGAMEGYQSMMKLSGTITATLTAWQTSLAAATAGSGVASKAAAVGMRILNAVMNLNPVFLLITGITALAGAMYLFGDSEETAAEKAAKLNAELEAQMKISQNLSNLESILIEGKIKEIELANEKTRESIQIEIDLLEIKTEKTQQENDKLKALRTSLVDHNKESMQEEFDKTLELFDAEETATREKYNNLAEQRRNLSKTIGSLEDEELTAVLDNIDQIGDEMDNLQNQLQGFVSGRTNLIAEWKNRAIKLENDRAREEAQIRQKEADEYKKKLLERRKALYDSLNDEIKRRKSANEEITALEIEMMDNLQAQELELQNLSYGDAKQQLIDGAIAREIASVDQKFIDLKLSQEEWEAERLRIESNGINNLLVEEQRLLDKIGENNQAQLDLINQRYANEALLTKEQTDVINSNRLLAEVQYQKDLEMLQVSGDPTLTEAQRQEKIFAIKTKYLQKEIDAIKENLKEEEELRTQQYLQDINQKGLTTEQKENIDAQYTSDMVTLYQGAQMQIAQLEADSMASREEKYNQTISKIAEWTDRVAAVVTQTLDIMSQYFQQVAAAEAETRNQQFQSDSEAFKAQLANREISQQEYDDKVRLLEQKKYQQELAAKRKAFKQQKHMAIVGANMATAQAVVAGLNNPFPLNIIMAALNGALGVAQIAIIASQKFQAARGGIVPGAPSKRDSVDAMLAPGEMVINSESSQMFPELLSQINQAGGGISLAPEPASVGNTGFGSRTSVFRDNQEQPMIKTYVVETDITDSQKRVNRIERSAQF